MKERLYLIDLYDYYSSLLTTKQCEYFEDYYFNNLSLGEISTNHDVSRNAVFKNLKETVNKLHEYEKKLNIYYKANKIKKIILTIDEKTRKKIINILDY